MPVLKTVLRFFSGYKLLTFVALTSIVGGILQLTKLPTLSHWALSIGAIVAAIPLLWGMIEDIRSGAYGIDILAITAIVTSVALHQYWTAIVIALMLTGGEALENYAEQRAKTELSSLLARKPKQAHLIRGQKTVDVAVQTIAVGDKLEVLPGEVIPVDAVILEGTTTVDESSLTGESVPVEKSVNDELLSGSINMEGAITIRAVRPEAESQYEQIIRLVRAAASTQSPFVRLTDRFSIPFTIVAFMLAGAAWLISGESIRFLEVIVVATPCPLLLAAPIALISGMSRAAKQGIIIKTGSALERLAEAQTVAFDKTGTLTVGKPMVDDVTVFGKFKKDEVLGFAASLEQSSNHVLAQAIVTAATNQRIAIEKAHQVKEASGHGLSGRLGDKDILVGRLTLLKNAEVSLPKDFRPDNVKQTATFVAIHGELAGAITFKDEIRSETKDMLQRLKKAGIKHAAMVTGDNKVTALAIAKELNITDVYPECLPADKLAAIGQMKAYPVAFVGDGVNDAPVLAAADIGIALGARGSTAASESADVVILHDDVGRVAEAIQIAQRTFFIAKQSILIGVFISLGMMAVFATGKFQPIYGAALQEVVDVIVIFNALRAHGPFKPLGLKAARASRRTQ